MSETQRDIEFAHTILHNRYLFKSVPEPDPNPAGMNEPKLRGIKEEKSQVQVYLEKLRGSQQDNNSKGLIPPKVPHGKSPSNPPLAKPKLPPVSVSESKHPAFKPKPAKIPEVKAKKHEKLQGIYGGEAKRPGSGLGAQQQPGEIKKKEDEKSDKDKKWEAERKKMKEDIVHKKKASLGGGGIEFELVQNVPLPVTQEKVISVTREEQKAGKKDDKDCCSDEAQIKEQVEKLSGYLAKKYSEKQREEERLNGDMQRMMNLMQEVKPMR